MQNADLLMFYNVENLFPPDPKPVHKLDPTNSGLRNWDENRYKSKIQKIAHVFELVKEEQHFMPVLIGLSEIQSESVLQDIISQPVFEGKFKFIHYESLDERGVDVALLYDTAKCEIIHSEPISFLFEFTNPGSSSFDTTRDVLFCRLKLNGETVDLYVVHLPSKRERDVNKPKRDYILKQIKERILEERNENPFPVIVCGDFNDDSVSGSVKEFMRNGDADFLKNPFQELYEQKNFSTFHNADGLLFDQFILSEDFYEEKSALRFEQASVFNNYKLATWDRKFQGRPFRTYAGTRYIGGYSDHFPVLIKLNYNENKF